MSVIKNPTESTLVHTEALKLQSEQTSGYRSNLIHANAAEYWPAYRYYKQFDDSYEFSKFKLFIKCRNSAYFARQKSTGRVSLIANSCHQRWCPFCAKAKTNIIRKNTREWLKKINHPKFLTFTLAHSKLELFEQIDILYKSFKQLRRIKMFKKAAQSGVWFFQIVRSKTDGLWHPHLHVITGGAYIPHRKLSDEWKRITGESFIVDIRAIKDPDKASDYVARYASKTCNITQFSLNDLCEIGHALQNHRVCGSWGSANKAKLTTLPKMDRGDWQMLGRYTTIIGLAKIDARAAKILEAYKSGQTIDDGIDVCDFDEIRKGEPPPPESNYEVCYD
jgi:hypothetical protein